MAYKETQDGILKPILVAVVIALLVGGTSPWWWGQAEYAVSRVFGRKLIPDTMAGVWTGQLFMTDNAGVTNVVYILHSDGRIVVKDDPTYKHEKPTIYEAKANAETVSFSLNVEGLGAHRCELRLTQPETLHVKVFKHPESQGVLTEGDLTHSSEVPSD
jgi:hypothetical protein